MDLDVYQLLVENPALLLFLILGFGYLVGNIRIGGVALGSVTGVLLVGLVFGHWQFSIPQSTQHLGFILFIYCVGLQAGPQFLEVFRSDGRRYVQLSLITAVVAYALAEGLSGFFGFATGFDAGLLAGGLTSSPTLVAAQDALSQADVIPPGTSRETIGRNIAAGYAITYVFGMGGLVLMLSFLPKLLRIDLEAEARKLSQERGYGAERAERSIPADPPIVRSYRISHETWLARPLAQLDLPHALGTAVQKLKRDGEIIDVDPDTELRRGDVVAVVAPPDAHARLSELFGSEIVDHDVLDRSTESWSVMATSVEVAGLTIAELAVTERYGCWLTKLTRSGVDVPIRHELRIKIGDVLLLTGARTQLAALAERLGYVEREIQETDLVTLAFGIALGVFLGTITLNFGGVAVGLGTAGGVLVAGLLLGFLRSYRPTFGRVPAAARHVLMELGLLLFMASVGLSAGSTVVPTLETVGLDLVFCGMIVTTVPLAVTFVYGRYWLKMNPALLLGAITGAMTSTAALMVITNQSKSTAPTLGYVGSYAFANVFLALAGGLIMRL